VADPLYGFTRMHSQIVDGSPKTATSYNPMCYASAYYGEQAQPAAAALPR
jgi:hypothetical protein